MNDVALQEIPHASPLFRIFVCGPFRVEHWQHGRWQAVPRSTWSSNNYARLLLKHLLCHPQRSVPRSILQRDLWPGIIPKESAAYLNNAVSVVRVTLKPEGAESSLLLDVEEHTRYGLAGQERLWVDVEAALSWLHEAEAAEGAGRDPLPSLEEAAAFLSRGIFLEGEDASWVKARRATVARAWRGCRLWQARLYQQREQWNLAQPLLDGLLEENPDDEDALCSLMQFLQARGRPSEAMQLYHELVERLAEQGKQPLETTRALAEHLRSALPPTPLSLPPHASSSLVLVPKERPSLPVVTQGIIGEMQENQEREEQDMNRLRRQLLQFGMAGTAFIPPISDAYYSEMLERFLRALKRPSSIDRVMLNYLHEYTMTYWQERACNAFASCDLLLYTIEHFKKLTTLLEGTLLPVTRTHVCLTASRTALLIGVLLYDMGNYEQARYFQKVALEAAQEANNSRLQAICWAWISFTWTYSKNTQKALICIQEARRVAAKSPDMGIETWLAAIEAEIQASLHQSDACFEALDQAEKVKDVPSLHEDYFLSHFDSSLLAGYKGICFQKLYHPEKSQTHVFLMKSQEVLEEAIKLLGPAKSNQSNYMVDLAGTLALQGEIEEACRYAIEVVAGLRQTKSLTRFRRLADLRQALDPWKDTQYVQQLDAHIADLPFEKSI